MFLDLDRVLAHKRAPPPPPPEKNFKEKSAYIQGVGGSHACVIINITSFLFIYYRRRI